MFPELTDRVRLEMQRHNTDWAARWNIWCQYGGIPGCGLGQIVDPPLRGWVETFLPWREFASSLRRLGRAFLPDPEWLPLILQSEDQDTPFVKQNISPLSLLEFWPGLPKEFKGKLCFSPEELLPFFCALADPPRYGTVPGRYPEQIHAFQRLLNSRKYPQPIRLLDLGCGVALGSLELLETARACGFNNARLTGMTAQPLEVWMARQRKIPHDTPREKLFQTRFAELQGTFLAGQVQKFQLPEKYDFIFCNGLAGGQFLQYDRDIMAFLDCCRQHLVPCGCVLLANHFHEGCRPGVDRLLKLAQQNGWQREGTWQNLLFIQS